MKKVFTIFYLIATFSISFALAQKTIIDSTLIKKYLQSSLSQKEPLWVVDGKIYDKKISEVLKENYIESVEVLRESGALIVYGLAGKEGAILVKTKNISPEDIQKLMNRTEFIENEKYVTHKISGQTNNYENIPFANVKIRILNDTIETQSDNNGKFTIKTKIGDVLQFSKKGMITQKIKVENTNAINVSLLPKPIEPDKIIKVSVPLIYMYSQKKSNCSFQIETNGKILETNPNYYEKWNLITNSNGEIIDDKSNKKFNSISWEGEFKFPVEHFDYKSGFVVTKNKLADFLSKKLQEIGVNTLESFDFIQYYLPILEKNETNFIHFYVNEETEIISKNNINPKPETEIRVYIEFHKLSEKITVPEQQFAKKSRKGFTVVELAACDVTNALSKED